MTQPARTLPVARFVGSAAVGKQRLVRALLLEQQNGAETSSSEAAKQRSGDGDESSTAIAENLNPDSPSLWTLDTRYYTAELSLERSRIGAEEADEDEEGRTSAATVEAVVLVFDPARAETFAAATRWWSRVEGGAGEESNDPAVKLCVAHGDDGEDASGSDLKREAEAWCVDNAFELIEVSSLTSSSPSSLSLSPSETGLARLRDALAAHAWPGLVRKSAGEVEAARKAAVAAAERKRRKEQGEETENEERAYTPPLSALDNDDDDDGDALLASSVPPLRGFEAACTGAAGIEGLEELFRSLSAARTAVATLPDEERRERAAEMALRLAEALGIEDGDSEDEESDSEAEEEERRRQRREV